MNNYWRIGLCLQLKPKMMTINPFKQPNLTEFGGITTCGCACGFSSSTPPTCLANVSGSTGSPKGMWFTALSLGSMEFDSDPPVMSLSTVGPRTTSTKAPIKSFRSRTEFRLIIDDCQDRVFKRCVFLNIYILYLTTVNLTMIGVNA